jgi:hypothetical protein
MSPLGVDRGAAHSTVTIALVDQPVQLLLMSASTVIVAISAQLLRRARL